MYKIHDAQRDASLKEIITELHARLDGTDKSIEELEQRIESIGDSPGGGGEVPADYLERVETTRRRAELASNPDHTRVLAEGAHEDDGYHETRDGNGIGGWGLVLTPDEDVYWNSAAVHAAESGSMRLDIFEMDYVAKEKYDVGERVMTRDIQLNGGRQTVYPGVVLEAGQDYFTTRDGENPTAEDNVRLKRGTPLVQWRDLNDAEVPIAFHCSWQLGRGGPGTDAYEDYRDNDWHRILHHFRSMEFGYMDSEG